MSARQLGALLWMLSAVALCSACSSTGRDFVRPEPGTLVLGNTTPTEVLTTFGEPAERTSEPGDVTMVDAFETLQPRPAGLKKALVKGEILRLRAAAEFRGRKPDIITQRGETQRI